MIDAADDLRLALAATLRAGDSLELAAAAGALVTGEIERIDGVDFCVRLPGTAALSVGSLLAARVHDGVTAWFCTFIALDASVDADGACVAELRLGDADRITSERWSERRPLECPALLRREDTGAVVRGVAVDGSATGIAVLLREGDVPAATMLGVTLAGLGGGGIAFRGLVRRRTWTHDGRLLGIEIADMSTTDLQRLERALADARARQTQG
jgi:hypothetical protein